MAGFLDRAKKTTIGNFINNNLLKLSSLGMRYNDQVLKQSKAIGVTESTYGQNTGYLADELLFTMRMADIGQKKFIAYYNKQYKDRREFLRRFAMNSEIEFILDTIADEAIVYDEKNFFCYPDLSNLSNLKVVNDLKLKDEKTVEISKAINANFKKIYSRFHFNDDVTAWNYFRKFLVDGYLAFEIIYDEDGKQIIGFKELDATTLEPIVEETKEGIKRFWVQSSASGTTGGGPKLEDARIIYLSYGQGNILGRVSYVERLIRSWNLLRLIEHSRAIWNIMHATFRLKMVVPIGDQVRARGDQSLGQLINYYREEIYLDSESGELSINGKPSIGQFYKNYAFVSKNGETIDVSTVEGTGPNLNDTEALKYFQRKLQADSKVPSSRFDKENTFTITFGAEGMDREEIRFSKFINRLRSTFQELLVKPTLLQTLLEYPELADDEIFKMSVGIKYNKDNLFEQMKTIEITQKRLDFCTSLVGFNKAGDKPYFSTKWVVEKFLGITTDDLETNEQYLKEEQGSMEKPTKEEKPTSETPPEEETPTL